MLAKYKYLSTATAAQVQADILLLLTGTTSTASLSASCDKPNTRILTTYDSAGWSSYDSAAYTNGFAVRRLQQDGVTYKYVTFECSSTTAWALRIAESWNSGTHAGTNVTGYTGLAWAASSGGTFFIYATADVVIIKAMNAAGNTFTNTIACYELDNTDGMFISGYPTTGINSYASTGTMAGNGTMCRIKHPNGSGDLTTTSALLNSVGTGSAGSSGFAFATVGSIYRDASENQIICFVNPVYMAGYSTSNTSNMNNYGIISKVLGKVKFSPPTYTAPANEDTVVIGSTTYYCFIKGSSVTDCLWVGNG